MADHRHKKSSPGPLFEISRHLFGRAPKRASAPVRARRGVGSRLRAYFFHGKRARVSAGVIAAAGIFGLWALFSVHDSVMEGAMTLTLVPPAYTGQSNIVLISPSGTDMAGGFVEIPEGTVLEADLDAGISAPELTLNGQVLPFVHAKDGSAQASAPIARGEVLNTATLAVKRGWQRLGTWRLRVMPDNKPRIAMTETPAAMRQKTTRFSFEAEDDHGVREVSVHVKSLTDPTAPEGSVVIGNMDLKRVRRVVYEDLTGLPGAGGRAEVWLSAKDAAGQVSDSERRVVSLPERRFEHPIARGLIEERAHLIKDGDKDDVRAEVAGIMAGLARAGRGQQISSDLALLMLLRAGAVRLILNPGIEARTEVAQIIWKIASRIEDGPLGRAQDVLREAERDLADKLDQNATQPELLVRVDRVQNILGHYMDEVLAERAPGPSSLMDSDFVLQSDHEFLTREDMHNMIESLRGEVVTGSMDSARKTLERVQDVLESLKPASNSLTAAQKQLLQQASVIRAYARAQKRLRDQTFLLMKGESSSRGATGLLTRVTDQQKQLSAKIEAQPSGDAGASSLLKEAISSMAAAQKALSLGALKRAYGLQNDALVSLQKASEAMMLAAGGTQVAAPADGKDAP